MKRLPITLTLPEHLIKDLHLYISERQISRFVAEQVEKGLKEKKELLARAYKEAAEDEEMNKESELWDRCIGDGLDESNRY
jgi:hypothetical protein